MGKFRLPTNSFLLGEVSSKFYGRYDIREITQACRNLLNSFVRPQGGAFRRPGSRFVTSTTLGSVSIGGQVRLIPWVISKTEAYVVMIGTGDNTTVTATAWPNAAIMVYRLADDTWYSGGFISTVYGFDDFGAYDNVTKWVAYSSSQLSELKYTQFNDVLVICHPSHAPVVLRRMSTTRFFYHNFYAHYYIVDFGGTPIPYPFIVGDVPDTRTIPWLDTNTNQAHTLQVLGGTTGTAKTILSSIAFFTSNHVGARFQLFDPGTGIIGLVRILTVVNSGQATCEIGIFDATGTVPNSGSPIGSNVATSVWRESAWSNARGWPRDATFFQNRLVFGGTTNNPNTLWFSQVDDIFEMSRPFNGSTDNDAFSKSIATGELNAIQWLNTGKTLVVGTAGQEIIVQGTDPNEAISNSNFSASPETGYGSDYVKPVRIDNALLFVQRSGLKVREFQFNFQEDAYNSRDLTRFADHISLKAYDYYASVTVPKIKELAYQNGDNPIIWSMDNNGVLNALMRDKQSEAIAWSPVKLGGIFGSGTEPPVILSMCVVPSYSGIDDELWLLVKRTVSSSTVYFIERITREFFGTTLAQASAPSSHFYPYYLDCAINQTLGAPGTAFNGYTRLNGDTVHVIADGNYIGTKVVGASVANNITLSSNATTITAGYTYQSIISPILPDVGSVIGTAIGAIRRINDIAIRFRRTVAAKFGRTTSANDYEEITFRAASDSLSNPIPLFDGIKRRSFNGEYDRDPQIYIFQDDPLPMEVTSFSADGVTYD